MSLALSVMLQTTIVLVCAALLTLGFRRSSAAARHTVWVMALCGVLFLPFIATVLPGMEVPVLPAGSGDGTIAEFLEASPLSAPPPPPSDKVRNSLVRPNHPPQPWSWQIWIAVLWIAGTVSVLVRLFIGSLAVRRMGRTAERATQTELLAILERLQAQLGVRRRVTLKLGSKYVPPMTWGILRHVVLLPASALTWTAERQRLVLAHELAHVKRRDGIVQILVQVVCSLYWFNPLVWYASRQLRIERECACDNEVLRLGADAEDYADHLLQVARAVSPGGLSMATVAMAHRSQLETRLLSILDTRTHRDRVSRAATVLVMLAVAAWTLPAASVRLTARPGEPLQITSNTPALLPDLLMQTPGVVQGIVMQVGTGVPLKDVLVSLTPVESGGEGPQSYDVETRNDGTFSVTDLPPGEYRMNLVHEDFVRLHSQSEPLHVKVGDGRSSGNMRLHMMPGPAISGRIHDDSGNARTSIPVDLLKLETKDGQRSLLPTEFSVLTNEHGEYRFFGLEPGEYYLRVRPRAGTTGLQPLYYPGVSDAQHATPITVRAGADITGIDLALTRENLHSVRLKIAVAAPAPAHPEFSFYVNPQSRHGLATAGTGMRFTSGPDGSYVSPLLSPGTYEIEVYLKDPDPVRWARTTVHIDSSDVDAGTVVIPPGQRISGRVNVADNVSTPVRQDQLYVVLRPLDGSVFVLPSAKVNEDGTFLLQRVPQRRFRADITGLPPEVYLAEVRYGRKEVRSFEVGSETQHLELAVANAGGAVAGVVRNDRSQPVANGHVVLFPTSLSGSNSPFKDDSMGVKAVLTDQFGAFSIGGIAPGEYGILAWHSSDRTRLDMPYLMAVEDYIAKIHVERGFTNTVNVRALPPSN